MPEGPNAVVRSRPSVIAVGADTALYVKLTVRESISDGDWLGVAYEVTSTKYDSLHIPLRPPQYLVSTEVSRTENWARSERMLVQLVRSPQLAKNP
jgi:hypothetical protein